jgi:flagellar export protein FliJ
MVDVLRTVHRIRKVEEQRARAHLAATQAAARETEDAIRHTESAMAQSWDRAHTGKVIELAQHHSDALRLELRRRAHLQCLGEQQRQTGQARDRLQSIAVEAKVVEIVADERDRAANQVFRRRAQGALDEQGLQSWWRRSA